MTQPGAHRLIGYRNPNQPMLLHVLLKEVKEGALTMPASATLVQTTEEGVKIYDLKPPEGYTCLGSIAVKTGEEPDLSRYCCPKAQYVIEAQNLPIFKWSSSAIYGSIRSHPEALIASTFTAKSSSLQGRKRRAASEGKI